MSVIDDWMSAYMALKLGAKMSGVKGQRVWIGVDGKTNNIVARLGKQESSAENWTGDDIGTAIVKAVSGLGG